MTEELEQLLKNPKLRRILEIYDEQLRAADKDDISYSDFVTRLGRIARRVLPVVPEDDRQANGSQAEADSADTAQAPAREDEGHHGMAPGGGSRILPIPCGSA